MDCRGRGRWNSKKLYLLMVITRDEECESGGAVHGASKHATIQDLDLDFPKGEPGLIGERLVDKEIIYGRMNT